MRANPRRLTILALSAIAAVAITGRQTLAQQDDSPRPVVLQAAVDRFPIHITYYPAKEELNPSGLENAPVVVMLHGENGSRLVWDRGVSQPPPPPLAEFLHDRGYAVVTVDLRKFGESLPEGEARTVQPNDYRRMVERDLPAVKAFLHEEHEAKRLNVGKVGIIASDMSVPVAAKYAELDWKLPPHPDGPGGGPGTPRGQEVKAMVLLSPVRNAGPVNGTGALNYLRNPAFRIGFMVIVGTRDPQDRNQARDVYRVVSGTRNSEERVEFVQKNSNARGTDLLGNPALATEFDIVRFLDEHLKDLDIPWQTRISRYERD